ncbi:MAG: peptidylprolyl isomerase [Verrucomicrobia bacterium]|nr:MAG: peptidylprolyl isomerase [Verrucomicrobiota bacterium]
MKNSITTILSAGLVLAALQTSLGAENKPAFKDDKEKASYGVGMYFGNQIKRGNLEVDLDTVIAAMKDVLDGREPRLTEADSREAIMKYQQESRRKLSEKNKKEGEAFLAENKKKPGVQTKSVTLKDGTTAEMQYKVITEGAGATPKSNDTVSVNYRGTLTNGKEFDNSAKRGGKPAKFPVKGVVPGWTEALQMMKVGSKWELYLPSALAYADRGFPPDIEPGAALIFEMELVGTETPPPPAPAPPLTSDIIRVPSADELKAGAKIEVLKPEDVEKLSKQATNATKQAPNANPKAEKKP